MNNLAIFIYFIILGLIIRSANTALIIAAIVISILILLLIPVYKKNRKENIKNKKLTLNVNKAFWWEIEELPGFNRVSAKKAIWLRRHNGKYSSKEDFYQKNNIKNKEEIDKLICI